VVRRDGVVACHYRRYPPRMTMLRLWVFFAPREKLRADLALFTDLRYIWYPRR